MKKIYIAVIAALVLSVMLFVGSFAYLDKSKRRTYDFTVSLEGRDIGTIRVDKFRIEEKLIYKSVATIPFAPLYTEIRSRLDLGKLYAIDSYEKEMVAGRAVDAAYLQNINGLVSCVARYGSRFSFIDNIPTKKNTFIFEKDSPMTLMPIIENYDFLRGRSQVFNILTIRPSLGLPPMKRILTLTSINDEYLKIDSRKIKTEHLLLKMREFPQCAVWVAKSNRAIIKIEVPDKKLTITRSFKPKNIRAAKYAPQDPRYLSKEVVFKGGGIELSGTLTIPTRNGKFPAVLLVAGSGLSGRDREGFFASIADSLTKSGICVLRYDKRGTGSSKGDAAATTDSEDIQDVLAALEYLKKQSSVEQNKIAIAGFGKGALWAIKAYAEDRGIVGLILVAPELCSYKNPEDIQKMAAEAKWSEDYTALAIRSAKATAEKIDNVKGSWAGILGMRCYMNAMREETCDIPITTIEKIKIPILIMQSNSAGGIDTETTAEFHKAFADTGNTACTLSTFNDLGRFFGKPVNDGLHRLHYEADEKVMEGMRVWLEQVFAANLKPPEAIPETISTEGPAGA